MTISSQNRKAGPYIGAGTTASFPFAFKVFTASDLYVVRTDSTTNADTVLNLGADYTVLLNADQNANPGGAVVLNAALAVGFNLTITSSLQYLQPTDLTNQGGFYPAVITNALDRLTIFCQQLFEQSSRSLKIPISTPNTVSTALPAPAANKFIGWNADATALQNLDPAALATIVATGTSNADKFSGDGATKDFTLTANPGALNNLDISIGGVTQRPGIDYTWVPGLVVSFTTAPPVGSDNVLIRYMQALPQGQSDAADVSFTASGTGAAVRTVLSKLQETVSVKDFGAKGDGTTDDTAAIQAALVAANTVTFGSSADSYKVSATLTLRSGHTLLLNGATITQAATQTPMFDATGKDNVTIRGGRFVGKSEATFTNTASSLAICITASNATDLLVTENRFENFYYSPLMVGSGGNRIEFANNFVKGPGSAVLGANTNYRNCTGATIIGDNIRVLGNDIYDTAQGVIIGQGSTNATVSGNVIHDLINEHGIYADTGIKRLTITGNVIRYVGVNGNGIKVQHYDSYGVQPEGIVISGNTVANTGADGIQVLNSTGTTLYATGVSITGNTVYQAGQYGINVRYVRDCTISGNSLDQVTLYGIYVSKATVLDVSNNSIRNSGSHGIFDDGTSGDVTYATNLINSPGGNPAVDCGIFVQGVSEHAFIGNVVRGTPAKTLYCLFVTAASSLTTTEIRGNSFTGSAQVAVRLPPSAGQLRYWGENVLNSSAGNDAGLNIPETLQRGTEERIYFGTAAPTSGTWLQGTKVYSRYPAAGGYLGWVCVVGGTPGTWKTFGPVTA